MNSKRRLGHTTVLASALLALALMALLAGTLSRDRADRLTAQTRPITAQAPGQAGQGPIIPPAIESGLHDKVLHWAQTSYSYNTTSPDPANGKTITGDAWLQTDSNGNVVKFHARWDLPDGALDQEVLQEGGQERTVRGASYQSALVSPPPGVSTGRCSTGALNRQYTVAGYFLFVDSTTLPQLGYQSAQASSAPLVPTTTPPVGLTPLRSFVTNGTAVSWSRQENLPDGSINVKKLQLTNEGRLAFQRATLTNPQGHIVNETKGAYGALELYDPATVSTSVFDISPDAEAVCHG